MLHSYPARTSPYLPAAANRLLAFGICCGYFNPTRLFYRRRKISPQVGSGASLWYGAVVRGDVNHVIIGSGSSIGDSAVVHVAGLAGNKPTIVGSNVVIGEFVCSPTRSVFPLAQPMVLTG